MTSELVEQKPADRAGSAWDYVSASRLNLWLKCPLAFRLKYLDRVPEPTTASLFVGKQVHQALELVYRRRQVGLVTELEQITAESLADWDEAIAAEGIQFANHKEEAAAREQVLSLLTTYVRQLPSDEPRPLAVETSLSCSLVDPVTGEDLGMPLVGIIDLVLTEEAGPLIADFKTAASRRPPPEIQHEIQLSCYSYLFRNVSGQQETALEIRSLVKTKTPRIVFHRFAARQAVHLQRLFATVRAYLEDLERGRFLYRPGWTCGTCHYREDHCRRWCG